MEYRDFINTNMNDVITALNGSITPAPVNSELYRDFLNRKADDVITALNGSITPAPAGDELYRDFIERKFDDVIAGIGGYVPPVSFPTLTGSIVTFNSQYAGLPLKSHVVDVDYTGSVISGVNIFGCGVNVMPFVTRTVSGGGSTVTINSDGTATVTSNGETTTGSNFAEYYRGVIKKGTYFFSAYVNDVYTPIVAPLETYRFYIHSVNAGTQINAGATFTVSEDDTMIVYVQVRSGYTIDSDIVKLQLNTGDTIKDYSPFVNSGKSITFNTPIYGGSYDCLTGIVTSNKDSGGGDITPTYQQTATANCETSLGENNIWADTGDTTLQYIKIGGNT